MAFNHLKKLNELERLPKQEESVQTGNRAGLGSRGRTQEMLGMSGQRAAQITSDMDSSARGIQRIFARNTLRSEENNMSPWIDMLSVEENKLKEESKDKLDEDYDPFKLTEELYGKKGGKDGEPVEQSYFNTEIIEGGVRGNSRKSGDASIEVQETVVNKIIEVGGKMGMTDYEIAYTLAIARAESGFNPDAASTDSSATGIGQFIDETGTKYGITNENRWDLNSQIQALVDHTIDNFETARKKGYGDEYVYALHHDGIGLGGRGLALSKKNVMPFVSKYLKAIEQFRGTT